MTIETSVAALTVQTTDLLSVCTGLKNGVALQISDAVTLSTNAALEPLITVATNLINTQSVLVTYISR